MAEHSTEVLEKQEQECLSLQDQVSNLLKQLESKDVGSNAEISALELQNVKLKHRLSILKKAIEEESKKSSTASNSDKDDDENDLLLSSPRELLTNAFITTVAKVYPDISSSVVILVPTTNAKFGDYQCSAAMPICQQLKSSGQKVTPLLVAQNILNEFSADKIVEKAEIAGAGFINVWLKKSFVCKQISSILLNGCRPPPVKKTLRIVVDLSSPNVAKEMHVGHLRSTIIGDSIANLLEYLGHNVLRLNHIGDWGTQFGMLIAHLQDMYPNYKTESPSVGNLQRFYKESKIRFDADEEFKKRAKECVVQLQSKSPDYIQAWTLICDASRKEFQKIYDRLNINVVERGESFYQDRMKDLVDDLTQKGLLEDDEGRKLLWGIEKKEGDIPLTIVKSDGGFTYDTSDLTAFKQRIVEEKGDWIIYVVDEGQSTHFQTIANGAQKAGFFDPNKVRMDFVGFGVVLGEDKKKFKTRSGETVRLAELLDEGVRRAREKLKEKSRPSVWTEEQLNEVAEALAYGCIKYADLSHNRNHAYVFSFDKMLDNNGNTAVYLLYAYTRIKSISRGAQLDENAVKKACSEKGISLNHEKEWKLAKVLLQFNDILLRITKDLCMHRLCEFLYEVAVTFSEFYDCCYCIEKDSEGNIKTINMDRIILCEVTAIIMKKCFDILNIRAVSRM